MQSPKCLKPTPRNLTIRRYKTNWQPRNKWLAYPWIIAPVCYRFAADQLSRAIGSLQNSAIRSASQHTFTQLLTSTVEDYGVFLAFAFLLVLPMFMLLMFMLPMFLFPCMLAFALFVFAAPVLALAGVAAMFALLAVFEF